MREKMKFHKEFADAISELESEDRLEMYNAIFEYSFDLKEPEFSNKYLKAIWVHIKLKIDKDITTNKVKKENGKKGGRPKGSTKKIKEVNYETR